MNFFGFNSQIFTFALSTGRNLLRNPRRYRTIFALSSGKTRAAIAIIRISGTKASRVLEEMTKWKPSTSQAGQLFFTPVRHPVTAELLDKAMAVWLPGPKTFTGEDCCELYVHGGPSVVGDVLNAISVIEDCFPAEPGEFTKRAFFNGKFDLTGVEGLADLLRAETSAQRRLALRQAGGELRRLYKNWRERMLKCVAHIEAYVDFAEDAHLENTVLDRVTNQVQALRNEMLRHVSDGRIGERLRDGVRIAIIGEPNVGKSSLLNRLCRRNAAIVTPIAGTTRDVLDIPLNFDGYPVLLTDTAGLRDTDDLVEREGVLRAREKLDEADIVLLVFEATRLQANDRIAEDALQAAVSETLAGATVESAEVIVVINKIDLLKHQIDYGSFSIPVVQISCLTGDNFDYLTKLLRATVAKLCDTSQTATETIPFTQQRHRFLVQQAIAALQDYCNRSGSGNESDLIFQAEALRQAMHALGKITGEEATTDEMLDVLFRDFCIGK